MTETTASADNLTRREFLYYIWGASIALFVVEFTGLMVWFMLPRFREGEFGGTFTLPVDVWLRPLDQCAVDQDHEHHAESSAQLFPVEQRQRGEQSVGEKMMQFVSPGRVQHLRQRIERQQGDQQRPGKR